MQRYLNPFRQAAAAVTLAAAVLIAAAPGQAAEKIRVSLGDVVSVETLAFVIALERAKDRGVDYEMTSFAKEELAIQSIVNGQSDLGVGTPYSVIQKSKVPLKVVFQMSRLVFFPVASTEYKTWKDLNGEPFTFHARGTGTEAIGNIIAKREGIEFGPRSYVPGSENRIIAMMKGQIKASIVDLSNKNKLMNLAGDKFHILPGLSDPASDELIFASGEWIENHPEAVGIIVEELLKLWHEMKENPAVIEEERVKRNLLADQPKEILAEVVDYYTEGAKEGLFDPDGGGVAAARADFEFYTAAGQMAGPADSLNVEDYWNLGPLNAARQKLGL
ncbi:ABC transporter substrate-binding protein [Pelagibius litoralis]|uniref:ABC transporter substrate-binding protein n=1 Tax=Pelagibius litoralis TaxID=374515 RepID=A0A967EZS9_9PROT|nr:ABC transporter substrate-binding protein [Pelagibius litoralis]NIA70404.1 ABC transporter substrate-binding protein [Pelagibius litoralis]